MTATRDEDALAAGTDAGPAAPRGFGDWIADAPAVRVPLLAAAGTWAAAEVMTVIGTSWYYPVAGTPLVVMAAGSLAVARGRARFRAAGPGQDPRPGYTATQVMAWTAAACAWATAALTAGGAVPGLDPYGWLLTATLALGWAAAVRWMGRHEVALTRAAEAEAAARHVADKTWWHGWCGLVDLAGTHLRTRTRTRLGEAVTIDYGSAGLLESSLSLTAIAELWAQQERLPRGRVNAWLDPHGIAGQNLHVNVRRLDPWREPVPHPALDPDSELAALFDGTPTATEPLCVGTDPETGNPLELVIWDGNGGKVILVLSSPGGGKTVLMNCISERVTACEDAITISINFAKPREEMMWEPASALTIVGGSGPPDEVTARARRALAWAEGEVTWRSRTILNTSVVRPSRATPLILVKCDELPWLRRDRACKALLDTLGGTVRSEGLAMILGAQTRRAEQCGPLLRTMANSMVMGRFNTAKEAERAADGVAVPDLSRYGAGHPGVQAVVNLTSGGYKLGRTFMLEHPPAIAALARTRTRDRTPAHRTPLQEQLWAEASGAAPLTPRWPDEYIAEGMGGVPVFTIDEAAARRARRVTAGGTSPQGTPQPVPPPRRTPGPVPAPEAAPPVPPAAAVDGMPAVHLAALLELLAQPGGVSYRAAARSVFGSDAQRMTTMRWLKKCEERGWCAPHGPRGQYVITEAGRAEQARLAAAG